MGAFQFLAICYVYLGYLYRCKFIFDQQYAFFTDRRIAARDLAFRVKREVRLGRDLVSVWRYRLLQRVFHSGLQSCDFMCFLRGIPLFKYIAITVNDLDVGAFQFLTICHIHLRNPDNIVAISHCVEEGAI